MSQQPNFVVVNCQNPLNKKEEDVVLNKAGGSVCGAFHGKIPSTQSGLKSFRELAHPQNQQQPPSSPPPTMFSRVSCNFPCMSARNSDSDEIFPRQKLQEPVLLNVYDMYKINGYMSNIGLGVFHSGVEVYGTEYGFGGHQYNFSGIFELSPRNEADLSEYFNIPKDQLRYKQTLHLGYTDFSEEDLERIKIKLGKKFRGNRYHLINNNCNHFSAAFIKILCQKDIPAWINRLAYVSSMVPFLHRWLPEEWLMPSIAIQQSLTQAQHANNRDNHHHHHHQTEDFQS